MTILLPLKKKYLTRTDGYRNGTYRSRTGPNCCNSGCGRKGGKRAKRRGGK